MTRTDSAGTGTTHTPAPAKGSKFQATRGLVMAMLFGAAFGAAGIMVGRGASDSDWMRLRFDALGPYDLLLLPLTFFIVVLLHERCRRFTKGIDQAIASQVAAAQLEQAQTHPVAVADPLDPALPQQGLDQDMDRALGQAGPL